MENLLLINVFKNNHEKQHNPDPMPDCLVAAESVRSDPQNASRDPLRCRKRKNQYLINL